MSEFERLLQKARTDDENADFQSRLANQLDRSRAKRKRIGQLSDRPDVVGDALILKPALALSGIALTEVLSKKDSKLAAEFLNHMSTKNMLGSVDLVLNPGITKQVRRRFGKNRLEVIEPRVAVVGYRVGKAERYAPFYEDQVYLCDDERLRLVQPPQRGVHNHQVLGAKIEGFVPGYFSVTPVTAQYSIAGQYADDSSSTVTVLENVRYYFSPAESLGEVLADIALGNFETIDDLNYGIEGTSFANRFPHRMPEHQQ